MIVLEHTVRRVARFLDEIGRVGESEFPYKESSASLDLLRSFFAERLNLLESLRHKLNDPEAVKQECAVVLEELFEYIKLLGIIVRSTNVRNSFEIYGPLSRMASCLLDPGVPTKYRNIKLLLSSEWDYSPLTYPHVAVLPDFVLIGVPAPESSNALLLPLAGHEFGHSIWPKRSMEDDYEPLIVNNLVEIILDDFGSFKKISGMGDANEEEVRTNLDIVSFYASPTNWALSQAEETFCDFVGLRLFGTCYLESFSYLLCPRLPKARSRFYPPIERRAKNLALAATRFSVGLPDSFSEAFDPEESLELSDVEKYKLDIAEKALENIIENIINDTQKYIDPKNINLWNKKEIDRILSRFRLGVPAENTKGLPDILNAAWVASKLPEFQSSDHDSNRKKTRFLNDLVMKNIQIYEIEQSYMEYDE